MGPCATPQYNLRSATLARCATGHDRPESVVTIAGIRSERLREWMGITREVFYEPTRMAIVPMGFCYPGTGKSGDLPPRPECAPRWRQQVLEHLPHIALTLVIGQYAQAWHLPKSGKNSVTGTVERWQEFAPAVIPLPHPSPRNNIWLKRNPWFTETLLPELKVLVAKALA